MGHHLTRQATGGLGDAGAVAAFLVLKREATRLPTRFSPERGAMVLLLFLLVLALLAGLHAGQAKQGTEPPEGGREGSPPGARLVERAGDSVNAIGIHGLNLQSRLRTAVEARHQDGTESPASIDV